jgi:lipopolysaccharide/colanic/teichoic acid biosynthesis glycosyltransferase
MKLLVFDIITFSLIFFGSLVFSRGTSYLTPLYFELWFLIVIIRSFTYFYYKKNSFSFLSIKSGLILMIWSNALIGFTTIFILSITFFTQIPRLFAAQFLLYPMIIDFIIVFVKSRGHTSNDQLTHLSLSEAKKSLTLIDITSWLVTVFMAYNTTILFKYHAVSYNTYTIDILLLIFPAWLVGALFTQKYIERNNQNLHLIIGQHLKSTIILVSLLGIPYFFFRMDHISRFLVFGTAIFSSLFDLILAISKNLYKRTLQEHLKSINEIIDEHGEVKQGLLPSNQQLAKILLSEDKYSDFVRHIKERNAFDLKKYLQQISTQIGLDWSSMSLLSTTSTETISIQSHNSILVNFHKCNDQRRLNKYLIACHRSLDDGGVFVGYFEPLEIINQNLKQKFPRILFLINFPFHFIFHRIFPKMKFMSFLYFHITRGRNRVLSRAEMLGRLSYCGFDIVSEISLGNQTAFIAKKTKTISSDLKPSFKAIVSLKRVGYEGATINIFKIRTMHPYSEFLQKYVHDSLSLDNTGKFKSDFRLTSWGKIFRKLWIDELPQLYNWVRGDVKIVGVRALSHHYYSLYPIQLQQLRIKTKPGLIPPYYVDLPKNFEEIILSEERYLNSYLKRPLITDISYFFWAFRNIVLHGSRSH